MNQHEDRGRLSATVREIQVLSPAEAISLARITHELDSERSITAGRFERNVRRLVDGGDRAWILYCEALIVGYASIRSTPGLPALYELDGFIAPLYQRQRLASTLLRAVIDDLAGSSVRQLYHSVATANSPAAHFLFANGFFVEHEELTLALNTLERPPDAQLSEAYALRTLPRQKAISRFRQLYESAFSGLPWRQPYETDDEVAADLPDADDLLFLDHGRQPAGFLWLRWPDLQTAEIEPVGILPLYQGQGLGHHLMLAGIARATQQGARQVRVGVWRQNAAALALYNHLGFQEIRRRIFLARNLGPW